VAVVAPPLDTAGAALLSSIAQLQTVVTAAKTPAIQPALVAQLNALQCQAVDHFMATFWLQAASILSTMIPVRVDTRATSMKAVILSVQNQYNAAVAAALVTAPSLFTYLNMLQTELVDYYMNTAAFTAASVLSTMTGAQSQPYNYISNYTFYSTEEGY